jgi:isopentenyldiphosphate isomerase
MGFLDHIRACNRWDPARFVPWRVDGARVGLVRRNFARHLADWPGIFRAEPEALTWVHPAQGLAERSAVLHDLLCELHARSLIARWHGERYPVFAAERSRPQILIDRAWAPLFGARAFGQHLNGYVRDGAPLKLWIARRAADRRHYPGRLDNLVGGGLPWGLSLAENLRKECQEEAGMPPELADLAVPVGAVSYCREADGGLKPDVMYCYDLELPADFTPTCTDGEVDAFYLLPAEEVLAVVRDTDEFKLNCNLVITDFLIRHGYLTPETPEYLEILQGLRARLP